MDNKNIRIKIREFILDNFFFGVDSICYSDDDSLMGKGIVDSTGILELINFIEQYYKFRVDDDEILPENLDSLNNLTIYIEKKLKNASENILSDG